MPLHYGAQGGYSEVVRTLLTANAKVDRMDKVCFNVLMQ